MFRVEIYMDGVFLYSVKPINCTASQWVQDYNDFVRESDGRTRALLVSYGWF